MRRSANKLAPSDPKPACNACFVGGDSRGFTLLELVIAMAIFLVVSAASLGLFVKEQTALNRQQGDVALNIGLRNATSQLQLDLANAGTGQFVGINIPAWPVGVTIFNSDGVNCHAAGTTIYAASCFDTLNIISVDLNTPAIHPDQTGTGCTNANASSSFADPANGLTADQTAALFHSGDQLLFVSSDGSKISSVVLSQDANVSGNLVHFVHNPTADDGTNTQADDPLGITTHANNKLGTQFCTSDWILKLAPITYSVDTTTDPTNPKLIRQYRNPQTGALVTDTVMEQVIGFKVGATIWNSSTDVVSTQYNYDSSTYTNTTPGDQAYNFTLVRSVRVSLIGRTAPSLDPGYTFRNEFDQGPYQIQGATVVVNPRNLSMND